MQQQPSSKQEPLLLLQLPQECLEAVLQQLRDGDEDGKDDHSGSHSDSHSVCSAARAHSALHAAAVAALSSIEAKVEQPQLDSLMLYLARHGQHVTSLLIEGPDEDEDADCDVEDRQRLSLAELPACSQLRSLSLDLISVQLGTSSSGHQGVLQSVPQLSKLHLEDCTLLDTDSGALTVAVSGLTALQHLQLGYLEPNEDGELPTVSIGALAQQQLTHLEAPVPVLDNEAGWRQQVCGLRHLRELGLQLWEGDELRAGNLTGLQHLTRLEVEGWNGPGSMEPSVLADLPHLQRLVVWNTFNAQEHGGEPPALSLLQQLGRLQLTCLRIGCLDGDFAPAAAYSALTASSVLQHLEFWDTELPPGAWQHVFGAGRQLSALQQLEASGVAMPSPRDVESMVAACPGLQRLTLEYECLDITAAQRQQMSELLAPLSRLSHLTELALTNVDDAAAGAVLAQLSGLRSLEISSSGLSVATGLLALTQLRGLTTLSCGGGRGNEELTLDNKAPDGSPPDVWRQLLEHCKQQGVEQAVEAEA